MSDRPSDGFTENDSQPTFDSEVDLVFDDRPIDTLTPEELKSELLRSRNERIRLMAKFVLSQEEVVNLKGKLKEIESRIYMDPLTKCLNREYFNYRVEHVNPIHDDGRIGLVFFNLNFLKITNDDYGYSEGYKLLKNTVNFLTDSFREGDEVIRIGGDEFIVVCRNDEDDEDFEENLNKKAKNIIRDCDVSMSFGVAIYDVKKDYGADIDLDNEGLENTKNRAGSAMQKNKKIMKMIGILKKVLVVEKQYLA